MKLENETAMPAHLECAKHKFSMLALLTKNCFFLGHRHLELLVFDFINKIFSLRIHVAHVI